MQQNNNNNNNNNKEDVTEAYRPCCGGGKKMGDRFLEKDVKFLLLRSYELYELFSIIILPFYALHLNLVSKLFHDVFRILHKFIQK